MLEDAITVGNTQKMVQPVVIVPQIVDRVGDKREKHKLHFSYLKPNYDSIHFHINENEQLKQDVNK